MFDLLLDTLEKDLTTALGVAVAVLVSDARTRLQDAAVEVAKERAKNLAEVATERATALAEVDARRGELSREMEAMRTHQEMQEGHIELNIGGHHFQTSVQTLRRVPNTFFDAYFSGRYAQDVCNDGSIFVDRDGEYFSYVLEYMRSGVVSMAEPGARPSVPLLRALKREFGFYCIELCAEQTVEPQQPEMVYVIGGERSERYDGEEEGDYMIDSFELYDAASDQWDLSLTAAMINTRCSFGACSMSGEIYVIGGRTQDEGMTYFAGVERYSPLTDSWTELAPLPSPRTSHAAVTVGSTIYVLGGIFAEGEPSVLVYNDRGTWSEVAPMPENRMDFAACVIGVHIFIFGGFDDDSNEQASVFKFDTMTNIWSTLPPMSHTQSRVSASSLNGFAYIVGAGDGFQVLRFDPISAEWSVLAPTSRDRQLGVSFVIGGCLYVAGGKGSVGGQLDTSRVERYDAASNTWTELAPMVERRTEFCAVTVGSAGPAGDEDLFDSLIATALIRRQ
jgi:N-acetylneuraminic acid mutarotase